MAKYPGMDVVPVVIHQRPTGWWLNAPGAKILNINPPDRINVGYVDLGTAVSLLGPEGRLLIDNPKIDLPRVSNCYGSAVFC